MSLRAWMIRLSSMGLTRGLSRTLVCHPPPPLLALWLTPPLLGWLGFIVARLARILVPCLAVAHRAHAVGHAVAHQARAMNLVVARRARATGRVVVCLARAVSLAAARQARYLAPLAPLLLGVWGLRVLHRVVGRLVRFALLASGLE